MYRALYKFVANGHNSLSFDVDDKFTVMDKKSSDWWLVQDGHGHVGYVPSSYLALDVAISEVLRSIDRAVEAIQQQAKLSDGNLTEEQLQNLKKLQKHRNKVMEENHLKQPSLVHVTTPNTDKTTNNGEGMKILRQAPLPPRFSDASAKVSNNICSSHMLSSSKVTRFDEMPMKLAEAHNPLLVDEVSMPRLSDTIQSDSATNNFKIDDQPEKISSASGKAVSQANTTSEHVLKLDGLGNELVEQMRQNTLLSYDKSKIAVSTVLILMAKRVPSINDVVERIMEEVMSNQGPSLEESSDAARLHQIIDELATAKDDSQQRSWFLHEDEAKICAHLQELSSILDDANPETSRKVLDQDGYAACQNLAQYYQMETRRSIRLLLLKSFGSMCALDSHIISELLNSVLPLELARDIQDDQTDLQKVEYSALVLSMIFSTGEALPLQYYVHLNVNFINFLLEHIECPDQAAKFEETVDGFVRLILAFNLHFELPDENIVMKAFAARGTAKNFTEKLLLLFNREDDPVRLFDCSTDTPNSVIKFVSDLYSRRETSSLLYTNDAKVLIDIIVRQLTDLSPGDKMRTEYLSLMHLLLKNSEYSEHKHRHSELQRCFQRISQDDKDAKMDRDIVQQIWKEFPEDFYNSL